MGDERREMKVEVEMEPEMEVEMAMETKMETKTEMEMGDEAPPPRRPPPLESPNRSRQCETLALITRQTANPPSQIIGPMLLTGAVTVFTLLLLLRDPLPYWNVIGM